MNAGSPVQFRNQVAGGGKHDRIQSTTPVGSPGVEEVFGECGKVSDVDSLPVEVEAQSLRPSVPQRQRCGGFGGVVESVELG
jgi:hypothetical protein